MGNLESAINPYLVVALLWGVIIFFAASIASLTIALGVHKRRMASLDLDVHLQMAAYGRAITLIGHGDAVQPPHITDFRSACTWGAALTYMCHENECPPSVALLEATRRSRAVALVVARLSVKDWGERFLAVTALGDFRLPELFDMIILFAQTESHMLVFGNCLYAAAQSISRPDDLRTLFDLVHSRPDISSGYDEGMFRLAIQALRAVGTTPDSLAAALRTCLQLPGAAEQHLLALVQAIGKEKLTTFKDEMVAIVRHIGSARLTSTVMRAIHNMGLSDSIIPENIGVRDAMLNISAIRSAVTCGSDLVPLIGNELRSPDFNVRYAAAITLTKLGDRGHEELVNRRHGSDLYARDMASFALTVE